MSEQARAELIDAKSLRAGINLGNILLVTGETTDGLPDGVSPNMATAFAQSIGVPVTLVPLASPGDVADALGRDEIDIGLIADEPKRAETINFTSAYVEIEATYLVPDGSPISSIEDVDKPGVRVAVSDRSAYDLYLSRTVANMELVRAKGLAATFEMFKADGLDALAGLRPALADNARDMPGSRVLDGRFTTVEQAIGTRPQNAAIFEALKAFVAQSKSDGLVQSLIDKHGVTGRLQVAGL